jgi:adenylosuccinate lyase
MHLEPLTAVSPIDGRYRAQLNAAVEGDNAPRLDEYFSEYALIKYRVWVEIEYLLMLADYGFVVLTDTHRDQLVTIYKSFTLDDAKAVKAHEKITNHDVKAVEYFIKDRMDAWGLQEQREWVHFGLTSQDVNNTAVPMSWMHALNRELIPQLTELIQSLRELGIAWLSVPMLARTHGQPASPTRLGKEILVFVERLAKQVSALEQLPTSGKFGGATGNFNAHHVAFPDFDWIDFGNSFLRDRLGIQRQQFTTQIENYDDLATQMDCLKRIGTILIDFCRDVWTYVSMDYFKQKIEAGEVGSSAMPHKVNPIDFENAEGNLGIANALWEHLASKLPVSRLQRDLTDSTVLRNIGVPFSHLVLSVRSIKRGLGKLVLNEAQLEADLQRNWIVIAEAIQTVLRREKVPNPYEALKELTRGNHTVNQETFDRFIHGLDVTEEIKSELRTISPYNYTGISPKKIP